MTIFPCSSGGFTLGQKVGKMAAGATWGSNLCRILEESGVATVHDLPVGTV